VARPIRFRYAPGRWTLDRVRRDVFQPLDANLGAAMGATWYKPPDRYEARRFEMDNGDVSLLAWRDGDDPDDDHGTGAAAYWLGNTETPESLWRTEKYGFDEVPGALSRWAERELLAQLYDESPWLEPYPHLSWFFLPVFLSKDGRETTREFFRDHAAGFPDADRDEALSFYEEFLSTGALDGFRETMAGKLGTSEYLDAHRMAAAMSEFTGAKLLHDAGYDLTPEIEVATGHSLDFRADGEGREGTLVEITRPRPPSRRAAGSPVVAVRDTAETKSSGQLKSHGGGAVLFVDCSSFPDDDWASIRNERPEVRHRPAVVLRARPDGRIEGYEKGGVPLDLSGALTLF
jgi:hypothetical protein